VYTGSIPVRASNKFNMLRDFWAPFDCKMVPSLSNLGCLKPSTHTKLPRADARRAIIQSPQRGHAGPANKRTKTRFYRIASPHAFIVLAINIKMINENSETTGKAR